MPRKILTGIVVSAKVNKTITVKVERSFMHPIYKKIVKRTKKYAVHVPENNVKEGDVVDIIESVPVSKTKKWQIFAGI